MALFMNYAQCLLLIQMGIGTEAVTCNFTDGPKDCMFHCGVEDCSFHPKLLWVVVWTVLMLLVSLGIGICCCCWCCSRNVVCRQRRRQLATSKTDCCCCCCRGAREPSSSDFSHLHPSHVPDNENHI